MRVAVTGANSAIGQAILGMSGDADDIFFVAAVRSERAANQLPFLSDKGCIAHVSYSDSGSLSAAFEGVDAIIHLPGVLFERPGSTYETVNVETTRAVIEVAREQGVRKLVLVSAVGAKEGSSNRYYHTKGQAEELVRNSGLHHTILRVPLLLGSGTEGSAALRRYLDRSVIWLVGGGRHLDQPLDVQDVAQVVCRACHQKAILNCTLELAGSQAVPYRKILERAAELAGCRIRIISLPMGLVRALLAVRQRLARTGFSTDILDVITADTDLDSNSVASELGIELTSMDEMIKNSLEE